MDLNNVSSTKSPQIIKFNILNSIWDKNKICRKRNEVGEYNKTHWGCAVSLLGEVLGTETRELKAWEEFSK